MEKMLNQTKNDIELIRARESFYKFDNDKKIMAMPVKHYVELRESYINKLRHPLLIHPGMIVYFVDGTKLISEVVLKIEVSFVDVLIHTANISFSEAKLGDNVFLKKEEAEEQIKKNQNN